VIQSRRLEIYSLYEIIITLSYIKTIIWHQFDWFTSIFIDSQVSTERSYNEVLDIKFMDFFSNYKMIHWTCPFHFFTLFHECWYNHLILPFAKLYFRGLWFLLYHYFYKLCIFFYVTMILIQSFNHLLVVINLRQRTFEIFPFQPNFFPYI